MAILATELRIGNLFYRINRSNEVHLPIEIPMKVLEINMFEVLACFTYENPANMPSIPVIANADISPIPLTPEILLKAGFEKLPLSSVQRYRSTETLFFIQLHKKEWFIYGYKYYPNGIKYLHELQNLFYILVGRELSLTL